MSQTAAKVDSRLWPAVWKLLRLQALILLSSFRRAKARTKVGMLSLLALAVALLGLGFWLSTGVLGFLRSPQLTAAVPGASQFLASVPVLVVQLGFLGILLTSFGVLLQGLYLAGDMGFLLTAPVPARAVFVAKLLQAVLPNLALFGLVAVPVLFGLGASGGYNPPYYPLVLAMLVALALAAAGLASLVVMAVVRVFPARRVAEVLGFAGALVTIVCSQSGQLARGSKFTPDQAAAALRLLARLDVPWSPLAWAGRGLVGIGEGRWLSGVGFSLLALGAAGLAFGLALTAAERLYYSGWAAMQAKPRSKKTAAAAHRAAARALPGLALVPAPVRAIVAKDWIVLRRDLRNLSQLVTPLVLGVVYAVMLLRGGGQAPAEPGEAPAWLMQALQGALDYGSIGISLFVGWVMLGRLATMGFSHEGKSYWLLKSAPVSAGQLQAAKFLAAYLPVLALGWGFVIILAVVQRRALALQTLGFSLAVVALCLAAVAGIYLALGASSARMDWVDPRQMIGGVTGCLGPLCTGVAMAVGLSLFAIPQLGLALVGWPALAGQLVGLVLGGAFCLACAFVPQRLMRDRVSHLDES